MNPRFLQFFFTLTLSLMIWSQPALATSQPSALSTTLAQTPPALQQWIPWVLHNQQQLNCPYINKTDYQHKDNHICAWASPLDLAVNHQSGQFSFTWQVLEASHIPLPGNDKHWPQQLTVNGKAAVVGNHKNRPTLYLAAGEYQIAGQFNWQALPQNLSIPTEYAFVTLRINNKTIDFPKVEGDQLWLTELQTDSTSPDKLNIDVNRKVTDGPYINLETEITLSVTGKMRELSLGAVLPAGFHLIGINSELPSYLDNEGRLNVKLKPGDWRLSILAWAEPTHLQWQRPAPGPLWPEQEVWVFAAHEPLRIGKLQGPAQIDPSMTQLPLPWRDYPSFLMTPKDTLIFDSQQRGKPEHIHNQLYLQRDMWLSFDHRHFTFNDSLSGEMSDGWRVEMNSPYVLESGSDKIGPALITQLQGEPSGDQPQAKRRGFENRYSNVNLQAEGTLPQRADLLISGWNNTFKTIDITLNLPPGSRLLAAFGVDSESNSWFERWTIWSTFVVLLCSLLVSRTIHPLAGLITGLMLVMIYHEPLAPISLIFNGIIALIITKYQPLGWLKTLLKSYIYLSLIGMIVGLAYFSATQIRATIYPQLENSFGLQAPPQHFAIANGAMMEPEMEAIHMPMSDGRRGLILSDSDAMLSKKSRNAPQIAPIERYQSDALIQTGPGRPDWQWHRYHLRWTSPVTAPQSYQLWIFSPWQTALFRLAGVGLILTWLWLTFKPYTSKAFKTSRPFMPASAVGLVLVAALGLVNPLTTSVAQAAPSTSQAAAFPDKYLLDELKTRLTAAPLCTPNCASISSLTVSGDQKTLTLALTIHAQAATAVGLPRSAFWRPEKIELNQQPSQYLYQRDNWIYLPVEAGIHQLTLTGAIALVDTFQLQFIDRPQQVTIGQLSDWSPAGLQQLTLTGNSLAFIGQAPAPSTTSSTTAAEPVSRRYTVNPYVMVNRQLRLEQSINIVTEITRIAPLNDAITVKIPLLTNEQITSDRWQSKDGFVEITLGAGQHRTSWQSFIPLTNQLTLQHHQSDSLVEQWQLQISPALHVDIQGPPLIMPQSHNDQDYYPLLFMPYPGESLQLIIHRPTSIEGSTITFDQVTNTIKQGERSIALVMNLNYRATRGGDHNITLPTGYLLSAVTLDGRVANLQLVDHQLTLPISPGQHQVTIELNSDELPSSLWRFDGINLNAPTSNINTMVQPNPQRWLLWLNGPTLGAIVTYWGELLIFILVALVLKQLKVAPLSSVSWVLLGVGLSLTNWAAFVLLVGLFIAVRVKTRRYSNLSNLRYNLGQAAIYLLLLVTLITLINSIPRLLTGDPDMAITGNSSTFYSLRWFEDQSQGPLAAISLTSVPVLLFKGLALLWVLWFSFAGFRWFRWIWLQLGRGGYWRQTAKPTVTTDANHSQAANPQETGDVAQTAATLAISRKVKADKETDEPNE